jgi:hypothetical protein
LIYHVIVAGAREALSAPTTRQYGSPDLNVPVPAESGPLWNSQEKLDGAFNGHKSGVHEGSLPRFLLEDSPNVNGSLLQTFMTACLRMVLRGHLLSPQGSNKPTSQQLHFW